MTVWAKDPLSYLFEKLELAPLEMRAIYEAASTNNTHPLIELVAMELRSDTALYQALAQILQIPFQDDLDPLGLVLDGRNKALINARLPLAHYNNGRGTINLVIAPEPEHIA